MPSANTKSYDKYRNVPVNKKLTEQQKAFCRCIVFENMTFVDAYAKIYSKNNQTQKVKRTIASKLMAQPNVRAYYNKLIEERNEIDKRTSLWTREQAIEAAKYVYYSGREENERIQQAYEDEIIALVQQREKAIRGEIDIDPWKIDEQITKLKKSRRLGLTPVQAMQGSIESLNRMMGYGKETLVVQAAVSFHGEDKLED